MKKIRIGFLAIVMVLFFSGCTMVENTLVSTNWKLTGWSVSSLTPDVATMTLVFMNETRVSGNGGVNSFSANYSLGLNNKLTITQLQSTLMASLDPNINRAEEIYFTLLKDVRYYQMTDTQLTLLGSGHNELLLFTKQ